MKEVSDWISFAVGRVQFVAVALVVAALAIPPLAKLGWSFPPLVTDWLGTVAVIAVAVSISDGLCKFGGWLVEKVRYGLTVRRTRRDIEGTGEHAAMVGVAKALGSLTIHEMGYLRRVLLAGHPVFSTSFGDGPLAGLEAAGLASLVRSGPFVTDGVVIMNPLLWRLRSVVEAHLNTIIDAPCGVGDTASATP